MLRLPARAAQGVEDFFVSRSNSAAVELIDRWPDWPFPALMLAGPAGSGKTHLAQIWRARSHSAACEATALTEAVVSSMTDHRALIVENLDRGIGDERVLFHLLNGAREHGHSVLLASRAPPGELAVALPDLRSRLRAMPVAAIEAPDEDLIRAVLVKLFADRQLVVEPHVVAYLALHVERSMAAVNRLVAVLDEMSLALHRRVTRPLARAALDRIQETDSGRPIGDSS